MGMRRRINDYFATLAAMPASAEVTGADGRHLTLEDFFSVLTERAQEAHDAGNKVMFVGNGGSAAIASHMANDFTKNGGIRAMSFNDASAVTCLGNDYGYEDVFWRQIEMHGLEGDVLIAISSSGRSPNILKAAEKAREIGCLIVTMTGFSKDNPLRQLGDFNLYVPSGEYGFVEISHLSLCHAIVDLAMGYGIEDQGSHGKLRA